MILLDERVEIGCGTRGEYEGLARWHYRGKLPPGVTQVWAARVDGEACGVLVVARPALSCHLRDWATGGRYEVGDRSLAGALVNRDFRTIARVVVHPEFQGMGVGTRLVAWALKQAETRYTEALAVRARTNPFFERAGMRRYEGPWDAACVRVMAALVFAGLGPGDLLREEVWEGMEESVREFLREEFRVMAGPKVKRLRERAEAGDKWEGLLGYARFRLVERPAYLLWEKR